MDNPNDSSRVSKRSRFEASCRTTGTRFAIPAGHRVEDDFLQFPPLNKFPRTELSKWSATRDHAGVEIAPPRQMEKLYIVVWCVKEMGVSKESGRLSIRMGRFPFRFQSLFDESR